MNLKNERTALCNEECNNCPIISHPNSKLVTKIFNEAYDEFGTAFHHIVQKHCPNLTCCYDCRIDDFCHFEGCKIIGDDNK